jgi:hypothetical protein
MLAYLIAAKLPRLFADPVYATDERSDWFSLAMSNGQRFIVTILPEPGVDRRGRPIRPHKTKQAPP